MQKKIHFGGGRVNTEESCDVFWICNCAGSEADHKARTHALSVLFVEIMRMLVCQQTAIHTNGGLFVTYILIVIPNYPSITLILSGVMGSE